MFSILHYKVTFILCYKNKIDIKNYRIHFDSLIL